MEDTPQSVKVRDNLIAFNNRKKKCEKFWGTYQKLLETSSGAQFDYGIYVNVVKNDTSEGLKFIMNAKTLVSSRLSTRFDIQNIVAGLDLSSSSLSLAYLSLQGSRLEVTECNQSFCFLVG